MSELTFGRGVFTRALTIGLTDLVTGGSVARKLEMLGNLALPNREIVRGSNHSAVVVHGLTGAGFTPGTKDKSFMSELDELFEELQISAAFPDLPNSADPIAAEWLNVIFVHLEKAYARSETISLVGFSLGTRAVMLALRDMFQDPSKAKFLYKITNITLLSPLADEDFSYRYPKLVNYPTFSTASRGGNIPVLVKDQMSQRCAQIMNVVCTQDDPTVSPALSTRLVGQYHIPPENVLVLPTGGHMKPEAAKAVTGFLKPKLVGFTSQIAPPTSLFSST